MIKDNMYRGGCMVLLQAILTQACRTIIAFCVVTDNDIPANRRLIAMASSYVAASEAASLIEGMSKHVLLTAVHLLCCEKHSYRACQHYHGEFAAAVGAILQETSLRSNILAALIEFIRRKWKGDEDSIHPLLQRALSVNPVEYLSTPSASGSLAAPLMLLLQVYPELEKGGTSAKVDCGCPHPWFRENLPITLLTLSMEQHAQLWRRTSLLRMTFLRWQQRHGMYLLRRLAADTSFPSIEMTAQAPSTVPSEQAEWPTPPRPQDVELKQDLTCGHINSNKKSGDNSNKSMSKNSVKIADKEITSSKAVAALEEAPESKVNMFAATINNEYCNVKSIRSLLLECDKLASVRLKRHAFHTWRDIRLVERCGLQRVSAQCMWRKKQLCWGRWKHKMECHRIAKRQQCTAEQCQSLMETKKERLMQETWNCWKTTFLVRRFRTHTCGRRFFGMWRRAYIFMVHAQGIIFPRIAEPALAARCLKQWRDSYQFRIADRMFMRRKFLYIKNCLRRRLEVFHLNEIAQACARRSLQQRCLKKWRKTYRLFLLFLQFTRTSGRRFLYLALLTWRLRWVRRTSGVDRMRAFIEMKQQRLIVCTFMHWKRKTHLKQLHQKLVFCRLQRTYHMIWNRWVQRVIFHRRLERDRAASAVFMHQRLLLFGTWRLWRWRCMRRQHDRYAMGKAALNFQAKTLREKQLLARAWFTWKGKTHLLRHQRPIGIFSSSKSNAYIGVNRSFPRANISTSSSPSRRGVNSQGLSVSFGERRFSPPRSDPLALLRAEKVLLRGIDSPQWQSMAHSRLFNASGSKGRKSNCPQPGRRSKEEAMTIIMMPSDIEEDNSPSAENSHILP
ncbi:hypothetical protein MOQ_002613 [Trypanosoma cruzi marinkellei]|uniref:Uncharacterized protein n=1 Tax=Trypanosoma cruzi marinkellei TaxID=85056 RepID=K2NF25_TRYCR|nr:hypothetical protein MOQ_002613 [Trypanosoma cruzi marinkellei]